MIGFNQPLHTEEIVTVEVDNRGDQEAQRIARWFINGTPQPVVVAGVPPLIRFGVCLISSFSVIPTNFESIIRSH